MANPLNSYRSNLVVTVSDTNNFIETAAVAVLCTVAGNVSVTMVGGSTFTFPVVTGMTIFPLSVIQIKSTGTTATATYSILY